MSTDEIEHKRKKLVALKRRLQAREIQKATYGVSADPSIVTEIEDLTREISRLEKEIVGGNIDHLNIANLVQQSTDRTAAELAIRRLSDEYNQLQNKRNNIKSEMEEELSTLRKKQLFTSENEGLGCGCGSPILIFIIFLFVKKAVETFSNFIVITDYLFWPFVVLCIVGGICEYIFFIVRSHQLNTQKQLQSKYQLEIESIDKKIVRTDELLNRNKVIADS